MRLVFKKCCALETDFTAIEHTLIRTKMELQTLAPPPLVNTGAINKVKITPPNNNNKEAEANKIQDKSGKEIDGGDKMRGEAEAHTNLEIIVAEADTEDDSGEDEEKKEPRISCCYGLMVFVGLALSLLGLTLLVIYAGFWSNYAMQGKII